MKTKLYILLISLSLLTITGCGSYSKNSKADDSLKSYDYNLSIIKSKDSIKNIKYTSQNPEAMLSEILEASNIRYKTELKDKETITMLDNVIATASKKWKLYVNYEEQSFEVFNNIKVNFNNITELRYE